MTATAASTGCWAPPPPRAGLFNVVSDHEFDYDEVGNVEERRSFLDGMAWRECFTHDDRNRMTDAFTVEVADTCDSGVRGEGAAGYDHSYTYSPDGRITAQTQDGTTRDYSYPAGGPASVRPHAPSDVEGDEYVWDANGQLAERTVDGDTKTFDWSPEHLLESITGPGGTTGFTYGPGGERLLRTAPDGTRTLYLEGHEVTAPAGGGAVTATRTYSFGGQLVATRTGQGVDYLLADQQGSIEATVPSGEAVASATRTYLPYGQARSGDGTGSDTGRGWIGQTEDPSSGLAYLNARYYDPTIGVFLSPDPLFDPARPQTLNPYAYGLGNPATHSDPTGLYIPLESHDKVQVSWHAKWNGGKGGFAGNHNVMIFKYKIKPRNVGDRTYQPKWNFWQEVAANPGAMAYFQALARQQRHIATLKAMNTVVKNPEDWHTLSRAVADAGGVQQLIADVEARRQRAIRQRALNVHAESFLSATLPASTGGGGCSWRPGDWGDCVIEHSTGLAQIASVVSVVAYASCSLTGVTCGLGAAFSFASAGLYGVTAVRECSSAGIMTKECGLATLDVGLATAASVVPANMALRGTGAHTYMPQVLRSQAAWNIGVSGALGVTSQGVRSFLGEGDFYGLT